MAFTAQHCIDCSRYLGREFYDVHKFLDFFAETHLGGDDPTAHRNILHNETGLKLVEQAFGPEARKAGQLHLNRDFRGMPGYMDLLEGVL